MHDHGRNLKAPYRVKRSNGVIGGGWLYELCAPSGRVVLAQVSKEPVPPKDMRDMQARLNTRAVLDLGWKPSTQQTEEPNGSARDRS
jgi:hypothetical protein